MDSAFSLSRLQRAEGQTHPAAARVHDRRGVGADEIGHRLDALLRKPNSPAFVSKWAAEIAVRLRQLVCAQVTGSVSREVADDRYVRVISDLEDERAVLVDELRRGERQ